MLSILVNCYNLLIYIYPSITIASCYVLQIIDILSITSYFNQQKLHHSYIQVNLCIQKFSYTLVPADLLTWCGISIFFGIFFWQSRINFGLVKGLSIHNLLTVNNSKKISGPTIFQNYKPIPK